VVVINRYKPGTGPPCLTPYQAENINAGMSQQDQPDRIKRRRAAITERMKRLDRLEQFIYQEKRKLSQEFNELAAVEKVLARLAQSNDSDLLNNISELIEEPSAEEQQQSESEAPDASIPRVGTTRPTGIPTTAQMFDTLLAEAERAGKEGLRGRDLVAGIRQRWWPGAGWNSILPTAFLLVQKGRLGRKDKLFVRVRRESAPALLAGMGQNPIPH
jgi:hypothetical protein